MGRKRSRNTQPSGTPLSPRQDPSNIAQRMWPGALLSTLALLGLGVLCYANSFGGVFLFDDIPVITAWSRR